VEGPREHDNEKLGSIQCWEIRITWLVGWLVGWLVSSLVGRRVGWLVS
jgi:hypothetical protein